MKGGLTKEVVSDKGEIYMGHTTFVTSRAGLTNVKGGPSHGWSVKRGTTVYHGLYILIYMA